MVGFSIRINPDYALEVYGLYLCRHLKDGLTPLNLDIDFSWYRGDHNPQFSVQLMVMNFMLLDFRVYNVHHVENGDTGVTGIQGQTVAEGRAGRKTVAILGGSFDPPTLAHAGLAKAIISDKSLGVDEVWLAPAYRHPFDKNMADYMDRVLLCAGMSFHDPHIKVSRVEEEAAAWPSAWDTGSTMKLAAYLRDKYGADTDFKFVVGADCANLFHLWKHHEELLRKESFIVVPRVGYEPDRLAWYADDSTGRHVFLHEVRLGGLSSTAMRSELRAWTDRTTEPPEALRKGLDQVVLDTIVRQGMYLLHQ